jgi:hypothetical protein
VRDFLIKLLGGYRAIVVEVFEDNNGSMITISKALRFYPFVKMIIRTRRGIISFNKNNSVEYKPSKEKHGQ